MGTHEISLKNMQNSVAAAAESDMVDMQAQLRLAMFNAITEDDVADIVKKQIAKAKAGDERALRFVMGQVLGGDRNVTLNQTLVADTETAARLTRSAK